jgi:Zn-dependent M16 (insulinase) family peptidase
MPDLSGEALAAYHARCYHPAAARFFFYGDVPLAEKLRLLGARLDELRPGPYLPAVLRRQAPWRQPRRATVRLGGRIEDQEACCAAATLSWLLGDLHDPETDLLWELVDRLLLGDDAAPLRRRLLTAGIGDDLTCSGYSSDCLQTTFHVGLKGGRTVPLRRLESLVLAVLEETATNGFPPERVRDAFRQIEYSRRDIDSGFPVHAMEDAFAVWLYGLDPFAFLVVDPVIDRLRDRLRRDPALLARRLRRGLLENPHRLSLALVPQPQQASERQRRLSTRLRRFARGLSADDLDRLRRDAEALAERQSRPNRPEALATLPVLHRHDLPAEPPAIPSTIELSAQGTALLRHDVPSNGITYITLAFDLSSLSADLLAYVPAYSALLTRLGTERLTDAELAEAITRNTGGLTGGVHVTPADDASGQGRPFLVLQTRTLDATCEEAVQLVAAILDDVRVTPGRRLGETLAQRRAGMLASVVSQGHHLAGLEAGQHLDGYHWLSNLWKGPPQVRLAQAMADTTPAGLHAVADVLARLRAWFRQRPVAFASCTGSDRACTALRAWLGSRGHPSPSAILAPAGVLADGVSRGPTAIAGLSHPLDTACCARCLPAARRASPEAPLLQIAAQILSYDYFWEELRMRGGAYGASCFYDPLAGSFAMISHSDPDISRTIRVFDGLEGAIERAVWTAAGIERAAIACAREEETPIRPGMATEVALWRHVARITQEARRAWRQAQLEATPEAVRAAVLELARDGRGRAGTAVLASRPRLRRAATALNQPLRIRPLATGRGDAPRPRIGVKLSR